MRQFLYNLGRLNSLAVIGAISGAAGGAIVAIGPIAVAERVLAVIAGLLMGLVALESLGFVSGINAAGAGLARSTVGRALSGVIRSDSMAAPLAVGVFNAFLPCQLIYAFAARAASTASVIEGMLTMLAFGLGTIPALASVALARNSLSGSMRFRLSQLSAVIVLAFALITIGRGLGVDVHGWMHGSHTGHSGHSGHEAHVHSS